MAERLSETDSQLFGSILVFARRLMLRADEYLEPMVLAAVPFAAATAWSVVTPLTAASMLAIGLPYVLGHSHAISSAGGTS